MGQPLRLHEGVEPFPGYRLRQRVAHGGFSEVWEAADPHGQRVALKFMPVAGTLAAANEVRAIQALRQLSHPNLLRIDQVWCQAGYIVIAMELMEGSLLDLLELHLQEMGTPVVPDQLCAYMTQAAAALDFLNAKRHPRDSRRVSYQHCDVKPSNFLINGDRLKLADYGLARPLTTAVAPMKVGGTVEFAAPEIHRGQLTERSDQYALGVSYVFMRTGRLPFSDLPRRFDPAHVRPEPDLSVLPAAERLIVGRALSVSPAARWPSCTQMVAALCGLFRDLPPGSEAGVETKPL